MIMRAARGATFLLDDNGVIAGYLDGAGRERAMSGELIANVTGEAGYDLWVAAGQSNISGRGVPYANATDPVHGAIWQYGNSGTYANTISQASEPLLMYDTPSGIGPSLVFSRWYAQIMPSNRRILLVPVAKGGTGFGTGSGYTWKVGENSVVNLFENAIAQAQAALAAAGANSRLAGVLWIQGETDGDSSMSGSTYQANLDEMIAAFRTRLNTPELPFIIGQMVPEYLSTGTRTEINAVHIDTPRRVYKTGFSYGAVSANLGDGNHYNSAGQRLNGRAMFEGYRRALANTPGSGSPIPVSALAFVQSGQSVIVSWAQPRCRATDYKVEYNTGMVGWVQLSRAQSIDCTATVPGLTLGSAVQFRVSTTNETGTSAPVTASFALANVPAQVTGLTVPAPTYTIFSPSWSAVSGATSYQVQYKKTSDSTWTNGPLVTGTSTIQAVTLTATSYDFRVAAINAAGAGTYSAVTTQTSGASLPGVLDGLTASAWGAWSTRKLKSAYAGAAIRVRRAADSVEQDIGFVAGSNDLDTAALLTFIGSDSAYVKTMYDQSGNARDLTQATTTLQPRIVNAGVVDAVGANSRSAPLYDGANSYLTRAGVGLYAAGAASLVGVLRSTTIAAQRYVAGEYSTAATAQQYALMIEDAVSGANPSQFYRNDASTTLFTPGGGSAPALFAANAIHQFAMTDSGSAVANYVDGAAATNGAYTRSGTLTLTNFTVGALVRTTASNWFNGHVPELIAFAVAIGSPDRSTIATDQKTYYSTP